jgi:hypothetical protein
MGKNMVTTCFSGTIPVFVGGMKKIMKISVRRVGLHIGILKLGPTEYAVGSNWMPNFSNLY